MSLTSAEKDPDSLTVTVTAELDATVERAWQLWADPRQFEKWWGPPGYSATVVDHDLRAGGQITFFMGGTEGERHDSTWEVVTIDERDGGGTEMAVRTRFDSQAGMEEILSMGFEEGMGTVFSQIEAVLAGRPT